MYSVYVYLLFALLSDTGRSRKLIAEHFINSLSLPVPTIYPYNAHARGTCVVLPVFQQVTSILPCRLLE